MGPLDTLPGAPQARQMFWRLFAITLVLKVTLAAWVPLTGDEAFFLLWGYWPDWGYSDHPPMVGWLLAALWRLMGDHPLALRSVTVLATSAMALALVDMARRALPPAEEARAWWAGAVYLALPWSWLFVLVTTDTPLVIFMTASSWAYLRAVSAPRAAGWYALAGLLVGLAFLSKYFAALLGLAYAVHQLGWRRRDAWWSLPLMFVCALPSIGLTLAFNAAHGWPNILFNFYNRNEAARWQIGTLAVYALMVAYLLTPWVLVWAMRARDAVGDVLRARALWVLWAFPLAVFAVLALRRSVGLHWVLGFVPLFVAWAALRITPPRWARALRRTLWLGVPHVLLVVALLATPLAWWRATSLHDKLVFLRHADEVTQQVTRDMPAGAVLMARSYTPAAVFTYHHRRYVPVFGVGRHHARQDDLSVDFRAFDKGSLRIFSTTAPDASEFAPYFDRVAVSAMQVRGVTFWVIDGTGFRFAPYRSEVLAEAARQFHRVPAWLPRTGPGFCERYGFGGCTRP